MEDLTGKQLGPYQIVEPLGEGGMAAVYKAYQPSMERYVALKILPGHFTNKFEFMGRFEQEAKILAQLQHPHILPVFDYGEDDGYPYIAMPFLQSGDLTDIMHDQPLPLEQIRRIISQVGDALDYAHQHGLVHRDVKPSNVLLDERGNCLLTDFGIAKIVEGEAPANFTSAGAFIGTPAYMSPEQGRGQKLDGRSDIYALGIMLYEMSTGRVPYRAETPMAIVVKHINDPLPLPRKLNPVLPEAVERVILKTLAKQPEDRYATAQEMVRAVRAAIPETWGSRPAAVDEYATMISAAGPTIKTQSEKTEKTTVDGKPSRSGLVWILAAVVVAVVFIGAIAFFAVGDDGETDIKATTIATGTETVVSEVIDTPAAGVPPTPTDTSTAGVSTASTLYDDFDNSAFDGEWNTELWTEAYNFEGTLVEQQDGILMISRQAIDGSGLATIRPDLWQIDELGFAEAKIKLDSDFEAVTGNAGIVIGESVNGDWWFYCNLFSMQEHGDVWASCDSNEDYTVEGVAVPFDTWHTLRFEIDLDTTAITFFVDGEQIDNFIPADPESLKEAEFNFDLRVWSEDGGLITGYFDDVRIGKIKQ